MTRVYNLFRRKGLDALFCAVPEERAVPGFVTARRWEFTGRNRRRREYARFRPGGSGFRRTVYRVLSVPRFPQDGGGTL